MEGAVGGGEWTNLVTRTEAVRMRVENCILKVGWLVGWLVR